MALLGAWLTFLLASMCFLVRGADGPLGGPPLLHPGSVEAWIHRCMENGPSPAIGAGFAALRLAAVALCGYLVVVTLASLVAHARGWSRAAGLADRRGPVVVSMLVRSSLGLTVSSAFLAAGAPVGGAAVPVVAVAAGPAHGGSGPVPEQGKGPAQEKPGSPRSGGTSATTAKAPTLEWVSPPTSPPARSGPGVGPQGSAAGSLGPSGRRLPATPVPATWTVEPGDSFWSIATVILHTAWGRPPTDAEVDPYWLTLIAANRAALLHPDVPDLIYAGQTFVIPTPPVAGRGG